MDEATTLSTAVGRRLREIRETHGWVQEDVARAARGAGLDWSRATVAAIETGRRDLSAAELVYLPAVLSTAAGTPFTPYELADLIPDGPDLLLAPNQPAAFPPDLVRSILRGKLGNEVEMARLAHGGGGELGEAEERAALRLGLSVAAVVEASRRLWGHSLTVERDQRVAQRGELPVESRRAVRGRITRDLIDELRTSTDRAKSRKGGK
jgi:transcriptional regulator with XRE-family HTH domain